MQCLTKFYECICCIHQPIFPDPYDFEFNGADVTTQNETDFESNFVTTSKYTWYDFIPSKFPLIFRIPTPSVSASCQCLLLNYRHSSIHSCY